MRHDFPSGAWAEFRPARDLRGKDKRAFEAARYTGYVLDADGDPDGDATSAQLGPAGRRELFLASVRAAAAALAVTSWSLDVPVPVIDPQTRQVDGGAALEANLPLDDLDELDAVLAPYVTLLSRVPDPKAPAAATTTASAPPSSDEGTPQQA